MAMGRREARQETMWVAAQELPRSPGHVFYEKLNGVLDAGGFDRFVEDLCATHYAADVGRPSIPPGPFHNPHPITILGAQPTPHTDPPYGTQSHASAGKR